MRVYGNVAVGINPSLVRIPKLPRPGVQGGEFRGRSFPESALCKLELARQSLGLLGQVQIWILSLGWVGLCLSW